MEITESYGKSDLIWIFFWLMNHLRVKLRSQLNYKLAKSSSTKVNLRFNQISYIVLSKLGKLTDQIQDQQSHPDSHLGKHQDKNFL